MSSESSFHLVPAWTRIDEARHVQKRAFLLHPERYNWLFGTRNCDRLLKAEQNEIFFESRLVVRDSPIGKILGAVTAQIDDECKIVSSTSAQSWVLPEDYSPHTDYGSRSSVEVYNADRKLFREARYYHLDKLLDRFKFVRWTTAASNPSLPWYYKIAEELGGGQVGRLSHDYMLVDGTIDDRIVFEITGGL